MSMPPSIASKSSNSFLANHDTFHVRVELEDDFGAAPTRFQRDWFTQRALREFRSDLHHVSRKLGQMIPGIERPNIDLPWNNSDAALDDTELIIQGQQVMQSWEHPLMKAMADSVTRSSGDVLEVGFGMGISGSYMVDSGVRSYTVIEANQEVRESFARWQKRYSDTPTRLVEGMWQDVEDSLETYDGIFFDTYPLSQDEYIANEVEGTAFTHCGEFFPLASRLLRPGGSFTYFTCEIDTLSRGHQRLLLEHFDSFSTRVVHDLEPPQDCQYWWSDSMVVIEAKKDL